MTESPPERIDVTALKFTLYASLEVFPQDCELKVDRPIKLAAVATKYGLLFVGTPNGIQCIRTADVPPLTSKHYLSSYKRREFHLGQQPSHLDISCDNEFLAVTLVSDGCAILQVYFVQSVNSSEVKKLNEVRLSNTPGVFVSDLQWNPGVPGMIAVVMSDGSAAVIEFKDGSFSINSIPQQARATCLCWSPKGKQVVIGGKGGSLIQYKPELKAVKTCDPPKLGTACMSVVSVHWLSNTQFIAVYKDTSDPHAKSNVVIVNTPKNAPTRYVYYEDLFYESETSRPEHYFIHLQQWQILVIGTTNSMDALVLKLDGENWTHWMQEDGSRAELPLTHDKRDVFNVGLSIDYSSTRPIPMGENIQIGPMPLLVMYAHSGVLCLFHIINVLPDVSNVCQPPQSIQDTSGLHLFITPEISRSSGATKDEKKTQERQGGSLTIGQSPAPHPSALQPPTSQPSAPQPAAPLTSTPQPVNSGFVGLPSALSGSKFSASPSTTPFSSGGQLFSFNQPFTQNSLGNNQSSQNNSVLSLVSQPGSSPTSMKQPSMNSSFSFNQMNVPSAKPVTAAVTVSWPNNAQLKPTQQGIANSALPSSMAINTTLSQQMQDVGSVSPFALSIQQREEKKPVESHSEKLLSGQAISSGQLRSSFVPPSKTQVTSSLPSQTPQGLHAQNILSSASQDTAGRTSQVSFAPTNQSYLPSSEAEEKKENVPDSTPLKKTAQQEPEEIDIAKENEIIIEHTKELIAEFNSEMEEKRKKIKSYVSVVEKNLKDNSLKDKLLNDLETLKKFEARLKDSRIPELSHVNMLGSSLMEMFGWYEKIKAKERLTKTSEYIELMESQDLDPITKHYLKSIDKLVYYLESQIKQAKNKLGALWDNLESTMDIPAMETIYQSLVAHHNILAANKLVIDKLETALRKINRRQLNRSSKRKVGDFELSTLADRLLDTRLTDDITMDSSLKDVSNNYIVMANKSGRKLLNEGKMNAFYEWLKNHKVINTKVSKNLPPVNICKDNTFISDLSPSKQSTPYFSRECEKKDITYLPRKNLFPLTTIDDEGKKSPLNFNLPGSEKINESKKIDSIDDEKAKSTNNSSNSDKIPTSITLVAKTVPDVISTVWGAQTPVFSETPLFSSIKSPLTNTYPPSSIAILSIPKTFSTPQSSGASLTKSEATVPSQVDTKSSKSSTQLVAISSPSQMKTGTPTFSSSASNVLSSASGSLTICTTNSPETIGGSLQPQFSLTKSNKFTDEASVSSSNISSSSSVITSSPFKESTIVTSTASTPSNQNLQSPQQATSSTFTLNKTTGSGWTTGSSFFGSPSSSLSTFGAAQNLKALEQPFGKATTPATNLSINFGNQSGTPLSSFSFGGAFSSASSTSTTSSQLTVVTTAHLSSVSSPLFGTSSSSKALNFGNLSVSSPNATSLIFGSLTATTTTTPGAPNFESAVTTGITAVTPSHSSSSVTSNISVLGFGSPTESTTSSAFPNILSSTPTTTSTTKLTFGGQTSASNSNTAFGSSNALSHTTSSSLTSDSPTVHSFNTTTPTTTSVSFFSSSIGGKTTNTSEMFGVVTGNFTSPTATSSSIPGTNLAVTKVTSSSLFPGSSGVSSSLAFGDRANEVASTSSSLLVSDAGTCTTASSVLGGAVVPVPSTVISSINFGNTSATPATSSIVFGATTLSSPGSQPPSSVASSTITTASTPSSSSSTTSASLSPSVTATTSSPITLTTSVPSSIFGSNVSTTQSKLSTLTNSTTADSVPSSTAVFAGANSNIFGSQTSNIFGSVTTSTQPFFGGSTSFVPPATSTPSIFGGSTTKSSTFGSITTSSFGSPSTTSFGSSATTASFFGSASAFVTTSSTPTFGSPTETTSSIFGAANALSSTSFFNTATTTTSQSFSNQSAASIFGGSSTFGTPTTTSSASFFGKTICSPTSTSNVFGTSSSNLFGQTATTSSSSLFGGSSFQQKPTFGQSGNIFGQTTPSGVGNFGSSGGSLFGGSASFSNALNQQGNIFQSGNASPGLFSNATNTSGPFSSPTTGQAAFGAAPAFQSPQRPFGGAAPGFGSSPTFGSAPSFGTISATPGKAFGSPADAAPAFSSTGQQSSTFENLAQQDTMTFGNLAQQQSFQNTTFAGSSFTSWR